MGDLHGGRVLLALDELRDELHRPRTVQCDQGDDFLEGAEADLSAELLHTAGLQLEDGRGATAVEQVKGGLVGERDFFDVEVRHVAGGLHIGLCVVDHGQRFQPEEVHFEQAEVLGRSLRVLRGEVAFLEGDRDQVGDVLVGDDHAAGVLAGIAHHAFDHAALLDDGLRDGLCLSSCCSSGDFLTESSSEMLSSSGIILASLLASANSMSFTRARSRTTIFAPKVPKVMMLATRSLPYLSRT